MHRYLLRLLMVFFMCSTSLNAEKLTLYTEEFPPFNFTKDGKVIGASTEVVRAIMRISSQDYVINSYPWARSFHSSQSNKNALIYSISRRLKREHLFKWIGVIVPANQSVFALKRRKDIVINSLEDMKPYTIGTTLEDSREAYLATQGFDISSFERFGGDTAYSQLFVLLKEGRIDLWPMPNAVMSYVVSEKNEDPEQIIKNVFKLEKMSSEGYYIAASLTTSDEIVNRLRKALVEFKKTNAYADILKKWGL